MNGARPMANGTKSTGLNDEAMSEKGKIQGSAYITRLNRFWRKVYPNSDLSTGAALLYFYILEKFNKAGWPLQLRIYNKAIVGELCGVSEKSIIKYRQELCELGIIGYLKGVKSRSAGVYTIEEEEIKEWKEQMKEAEKEDMNHETEDAKNCRIYSQSVSHKDDNDCKIYSQSVSLNIRPKTNKDNKTINEGVEIGFPHTREYYKVHKFADEKSKAKFVEWAEKELGLRYAKTLVELFCKDMDAAGWEWKFHSLPQTRQIRKEAFIDWVKTKGNDREEFLNKEARKVQAIEAEEVYYEKKHYLLAQASAYGKAISNKYGVDAKEGRKLFVEFVDYLKDHENQWRWREYPVSRNRMEALTQFLEYVKEMPLP